MAPGMGRGVSSTALLALSTAVYVLFANNCPNGSFCVRRRTLKSFEGSKVQFTHFRPIPRESVLVLRGGKGKGGSKGGSSGKGSTGGTQVVKLKMGKKTFEILAKQGATAKFREEEMAAEDALEVVEVFTDAHKFTRVSDADLKSAFGTTDQLECCTKILQSGEFSLSTAEKREKMDARTDEIIGEIIQNYRNAQNKLGITKDEADWAFKQAKIKVDYEKPALSQIDSIIPKLREHLNIEKIETDYVIKFHEKFGSALSVIKRHSDVKSLKKDIEGYFIADIGVSPAHMDALIKDLQKPTGGDYQLEPIGSNNEPKSAKLDTSSKSGGHKDKKDRDKKGKDKKDGKKKKKS